jgi:hypothetical protein
MVEPSGTGGRPDLRTPLAEAKRGSAAPITQAEQDPGVRSELRDAGPRAPRYKSTSKFLSSVPCGSMFPCSRRDVSMLSLRRLRPTMAKLKTCSCVGSQKWRAAN